MIERDQIETADQLFEYIREFMIQQGEPSLDEHGRPAYRGVNGRACAVGCSVTDEEYSWKFEHFPIDSLMNDKFHDFPSRLKEFNDELYFAQKCHDFYANKTVRIEKPPWKPFWEKVFRKENMFKFFIAGDRTRFFLEKVEEK